MINKENLKDLLSFLHFNEHRNVYSKHFPKGDFYLKLDFNKNEIIYPEDRGLTINERQTCNFSSPENFVVFECVHRLLEKGYKPEHIELEPKWKSGHGASGGRADILIKDQDDKPILIIECKTPGKEFEKAWRDTLNAGGQILTYADRERTLKFVCLYSSNFTEGVVQYDNFIITLSDVKNLVEQYELKDIKPLFYKDITDVKQWFQVWNETYNRHFDTHGIFDEDIQAYNIGQQKLTLRELRYITGREMQSKFNEFAEILRKYNVSSKEGAFDKLINLFLCKIVDENQALYNGKDLQFYWRGDYSDDYFSLIDRLQSLYKEGMQEYLGEKIVFIENDEIKNAFGFYQDRNATLNYVLKLFKQQKYFTNSDFGFIEVHNDKLFYQNARILLDVVRMWQDFQLNGEQQNQFLSDMFEGFLDKGFKQSEGQFFTPIPICKFIVSSLPLENILLESEKPPHVIDYACGAGHFLTEYAAQIKPLINAFNNALENKEHHKNLKNYYKTIFGVEKEYRLSKVAKISAFMYGQDEINIIYCDALKNIQQEIKGQIVLVEEESCHILVANPPFAVDGFLTTLTQKERETFTLFNKNIDLNTQRNIQCFFIERAKQLLAPNGVMGIIVPSSVLSNSDATHLQTREILLKYFDFISIVELGSGTFGKTGTNTVILFLRRRAQRPEPAEHFAFRTLDFFEKWEHEVETKGGVYNDLHLMNKYCQHIDIPLEAYETLLKSTPSVSLLDFEVFKDYKADFDNLNDTKKLIETKQFKTKTKAEQQTELDSRFLKYLQSKEKDKFYYFLLANYNPQKVLIVKSPSDNKEQKQFLGYEWSGARGSEGIKYNGGDTVYDVITPMFDPNNTQNQDKINFYIQQNFQGIPLSIPDNLQPFLSLENLTDLHDFSRTDFNKTVSLSPKKNFNIVTKWGLVRLEDVAKDLFAGGDAPKTNFSKVKTEEFTVPIYANSVENKGLYGFTDVALVNEPCVTISARGTLGCSEMRIEPFVPIVRLIVLIPNEKINLYYLKTILNETNFVDSGSVIPQLTIPKIRSIKIPLPPLSIQQQIVEECEAIDKAVNIAQKEIEEAKKQIENIVTQDFHKNKLSSVAEKVGENIDPQANIGQVCYIGLENIESNTGRLTSAIKTEYQSIKSTKTCFKQGDILYGKLRPNLNKVYLAKEEGICSTDILVFRFANKQIAQFCAHYFLTKDFNQEVLKTVSGQQLPRTSWSSMQEIKIPVPPLSVQKALVSQIEPLEQQLAASQNIINEAASQKQAVMKKYL